MWRTVKNFVRPVYHGIRNWRYQPVRGRAYLTNAWHQRRFTLLDEEDFRQSRKTDTLFIFGTGYSLNDIQPKDWTYMAQFDTLGFNFFVKQDFIRTDYHLMREIHWEVFDRSVWKPLYQEYAHQINSNPNYKDTILLLQTGWHAFGANRLIGLNAIKTPRRMLRFVNRRDPDNSALPTPHLSDGVLHTFGTLTDAVHMGYIGGWRRLVLVGIDLYDRRNFYLKPDQDIIKDPSHERSHAGPITVDTPHHTALNGIVPYLGRWVPFLNEQGIEIYIYNPRSLLAEVMPIFERTTIPPA